MKQRGFFVNFLPMSSEGENAFREYCAVTGEVSMAVPFWQADTLWQSLERAGYECVEDTEPVANCFTEDDDDLLSELLS